MLQVHFRISTFNNHHGLPITLKLGPSMIFIIRASSVGVSEVRQMHIHTAEPLVPEASPFEI
jgi:hypothetical protein